MGWLHCHLSFSLSCSSIQCIRGARSNHGHAIHLPSSIELTVSESVIPLSSSTHANTHSHSHVYSIIIMLKKKRVGVLITRE